jgi:hypothetical protein
MDEFTDLGNNRKRFLSIESKKINEPGLTPVLKILRNRTASVVTRLPTGIQPRVQEMTQFPGFICDIPFLRRRHTETNKTKTNSMV